MSRSSLVKLVYVLLLMFGVIGCGGGNSAHSAKSTPTDDPSLSITPTAAPFQITSVATSISPKSFYGVNCGSTVNFTFTTLITAPAGGNGGTINYTWNVGSSHIPGSVTFASDDTSKSVTYVLQNTANPLTASAVSASFSATVNGKTTSSSPVAATGVCNFPGKFAVTGISIVVSPGYVTGITCNSIITFTYTATVSVASNTNGGTVILQWFHSPSPTLLTFGSYIPGQTTQTITFSLTGKVLLNDLFPAPESITVSKPNVYTSPTAKPYGLCTPLR